jgi:iron(III) transport system permease protein
MKDRIISFYHAFRAEKTKWLIFITTITVLILFLSYPLGNLILTSLYDIHKKTYTLHYYVETFLDKQLIEIFTNTFKLAFMSVFFSIIIAIPSAWAVARTDMPLKKTIRNLITLTFAMPNFLGAIGWIILLGPHSGWVNLAFKHLFHLHASPFNIFSFWGIVFCACLFQYPLLFFSVSSALDNMDASLEDAAQILGASKIRVLMSTTLPIVTPAIISGIILIFLEALIIFGIVIFLGTPISFDTVSTKVYRLFSEYPPNFEQAATLSIPLFAITSAILVFQRKYIGKKQYTVIMGKATKAQQISLGAWKFVLCGFCLLIISLSVFLPSISLLSVALSKIYGFGLSWGNLTFMNFFRVLTDEISVRAFQNSFILAVSAAVICIAVSIVMSWIVERSTIPGRNSLSFIAMLSMSFPGVVLGVSLVLAFSNYPLRLYGTLWLFLLGYFIKGLPLSFMYAQAAMKQLGEELESAARILGASWLRSVRDVTAPLISRSLFSAAIIIFILKFRDMPTSMFLYSSGNEVVSILIYQYQEEGEFARMASVAILLLIVNLSMVLISRRFMEKRSQVEES